MGYYKTETNNYYDDCYEYGSIKNTPDKDSKRDIYINDSDTWEIYHDLSDIMKKRIPKNSREQDDFTFMKGIIIYLKQDGHLSQLQWDRLQKIYHRYYK